MLLWQTHLGYTVSHNLIHAVSRHADMQESTHTVKCSSVFGKEGTRHSKSYHAYLAAGSAG